jgi:cobalamin biosynthesis Mg chelatase CobN
MAKQSADFYVRYEAALAALTSIPGRLAKDLDQAELNRDKELAAADAEARGETERIAKLRRTISVRYETIAKTLTESGVLVPTQVRAVANQTSDSAILAAALKAQSKAEADVEAELRAAQTSAQRERATEASRRESGRQAAAALKRRQEQVRRAREQAAAEGERERIAAATKARRRKILIIAGVVAILAAAAIAAILWLNR